MLAELKKLACDFSTQPVTTGREMRELLENSPGEFCSAALGILSGDEAERVKRYLVALLWTNNLLIPCLTDAGTPQKMAESIADLARRVDPQLPAKLVNFVLERTDEEPPECIERILMILKSMPDAAGFRPLLTPLLRHSNARIRSKVALLAGEGNRNRTWFERRMLEEDPRVRANAIESAGQALTKDLRPLFRAAALDSNNRVVGNALIALYRSACRSGRERWAMIPLTRLCGEEIYINSDLIELVERNPDTVITLVSGNRLTVRETPEQIAESIRTLRRAITETGR